MREHRLDEQGSRHSATTESVTAKTLAARGAPSMAAISPKIEPARISLKMRSWRAMLSTALKCPLMME